MALVLTHPTCEQLPAEARAAVCGTVPEVITLAEVGDRKLVVGVHVQDDRAWDGGYTERRTVWASWKPDADDDAVTELLLGAGPVTGAADAWARIALIAEQMGGTGGDGGAVVVPEASVQADRAHPGEYVARTTFLEIQSCECSVNWTKAYIADFRVTASGVVSHVETRTSCDVSPKSARREVCGK